jgi:hypothetical protein
MSESACSYGRESRSHALLREELRRDLIGRDKQLIRGIFGNERSCMILLNSCAKVFTPSPYGNEYDTKITHSGSNTPSVRLYPAL